MFKRRMWNIAVLIQLPDQSAEDIRDINFKFCIENLQKNDDGDISAQATTETCSKFYCCAKKGYKTR